MRQRRRSGAARGASLPAAMLCALLAAAAGAAAQRNPCPASVAFTSCAALAAHLTSCVNAQPTKWFTARLDCTAGGVFDCTGQSLGVTGRLRLRPGKKCSAKLRPLLAVGGSDSVQGPLLSVSRGDLDIDRADLQLSGRRAGIRADGAASLRLNSVTINNAAGAQGACLWVRSTPTLATNSALNACAAAGEGGAVYATGGGVGAGSRAAMLRLTNTNLTLSKASLGGGLYLLNADAELSNCNINNNQALQGGAVYAYAPSTVNVIPLVVNFDSKIYYNVANDTGGAFYLNDTRTRISTSETRYNGAGAAGGAIWVAVSGATATSNGGDIELLGYLGGAIGYNKAGTQGGAVWAKDARVFLSGTWLRYNQALEGGGVYGLGTRNDAQSWVRVSGTVVSDNRAITGAGVAALDLRVRLDGATMRDNVADASGGALYINTSIVATDPTRPAITIAGSTISRNKANTGYGAALYAFSSVPSSNPSVRAAISGSGFRNNAALGGGAFYLQDIATTISGSVFQSNGVLASDGIGGAIIYNATAAYSFTAQALDISDTELDSNSAYGSGGAVYVDKRSTTNMIVACKTCRFIANKAGPLVGPELPGSAWFTTKGDTAGTLTVDLTGSTFLGGFMYDAAVCGIKGASGSPSVTLLPNDQLTACSASKDAICTDYCRADAVDPSPAPTP